MHEDIVGKARESGVISISQDSESIDERTDTLIYDITNPPEGGIHEES